MTDAGISLATPSLAPIATSPSCFTTAIFAHDRKAWNASQ